MHRDTSTARAAACILAALPLTFLPACRTSTEWADEADEEVYDLVAARRNELIEHPDAFSIEMPEDSLRGRVERGEVTQIGPLDLVDCLAIAAENNRTYRQQREQLYLAALDLTLERWRFHWQETGLLTGFLDGTADEATGATGRANYALSKLLGTGAQIISDIGLTLVRDLSNGDGWQAMSNIALAVTQPLLGGSGRDIVMEDLTQAERDLLYQVRSYERFRRELAVDVANEVYSILQLMDAVENEERNYKDLQDLRRRNEALAEAGRLSDVEVDQARQNELSSENRLIELRESLEGALDQFKLFLGLPIELDLSVDPQEVVKLRADGPAALDVDENAAVDYALTARLDYLTQLDRVEDANRGVHVAADALRARLNLVGTLNASSQDNNPLRYEDDDFNWSIGATFDLPLDKLPERNAFRRAQIAVQAEQRSAEALGDGIQTDLRSQFREVRATGETYRINTDAVRLAERRIESTTLNFEAGRATTRDLLEAQEDLRDARNLVTNALIDYTLARLQLYRDMELIRIGEDGISLADFPTP